LAGWPGKAQQHLLEVQAAWSCGGRMPWYYGTGLDGLRISGGMIAEQLNGGNFPAVIFLSEWLAKAGNRL